MLGEPAPEAGPPPDGARPVLRDHRDPRVDGVVERVAEPVDAWASLVRNERRKPREDAGRQGAEGLLGHLLVLAVHGDAEADERAVRASAGGAVVADVDDRAEVDTALSKLYERLNPVERTSDLLSERTLRRATPVPSTAIYSKGDGIVPWYCCIEPEDESTENVGVPGTHIGMPFNPVILYAIADRLQQPQDDWKPFSIGGMWQFLYGSPDPA